MNHSLPIVSFVLVLIFALALLMYPVHSFAQDATESATASATTTSTSSSTTTETKGGTMAAQPDMPEELPESGSSDLVFLAAVGGFFMIAGLMAHYAFAEITSDTPRDD